MARKDVDLVIRAKDEAAKVVDSITSALNDFIGAQSELNKSSGKTSSTMAALGASLSTLDKELKGLSVSDRITAEFNRATAATERLQAEFKDTSATATKLADDLKRAESATTSLASKTKGAADAYAKQAAALEKAKSAQAELTISLARATAERDKLLRSDDQINQSLTKQEAKIAEVTARYNKLAAEIAAADNPTKTLQTRLESVGGSLEKQTAKLAELQGKYAATQTSIVSVGERMADFAARLDQANAAVARQEGVVGKISTNYRNLEAAAKTAGRTQADIATAAEKTAEALTRQGDRIQRAETDLNQLAGAAGKANTAMAALAGEAGAAIQKSFDAQRRSTLEAKREWSELTATTKLLGAEIGKVGVPTQAMADAFLKARAGAAQAKQEYLTQRDALQQLSAVLRSSGTDLEALRAKQQQFAAIQAQTTTALQQVRQVAAASAGSYSLLSSNAEKATQVLGETGRAAVDANGGFDGAGRSVNALSAAYRALYGESRTAMSWTQRLRGEVLSLISAYAGIFGVINLLQQSIKATQELEAAQSRLNVAFKGDQSKVGVEMDFIRRNANRLGIELGTLAGEYSKFAIATQGTTLEGEKTRKIFISVAEAARVNKSSVEDMQGIFLALTQIVSKGAVQMEELRQQLGDRLPGALQLMADGLGVSTAQLVKMMEQGQVTSDALVPFAEQLDKKFGSGLTEALKGTTSTMGQFANASQQALVAFGKAGFIDAFNRLLKDLTATLQSADFQAFAAKVSQGFAFLTGVVAAAARNFNVLAVAISALIGLKLVPVVVALSSGLTGLAARIAVVGTASVATTTMSSGMAVAMTRVGAGAAVAATGVGVLTTAMRALVSSTGIGLLVTAISIGIGVWATRADTATEAMASHRVIVDKVKDAYERADKSAKDWADSVGKGSVTQSEENLNRLQKALQGVRDSTKTMVAQSAWSNDNDTVRNVNDVVKAFKEGKLTAQEFKEAIDKIAQSDPNFSKSIATGYLDTADKAKEFEKAVAEANATLKLQKGIASEADRAVLGFATAAQRASEATTAAEAQSKKFNDELKKMNELVPQIGANIDFLKDKLKLDEQYAAVLKLAESFGEIRKATEDYNASILRLYQTQADNKFGKFTDGLEASAALLRDVEGFQPTGKWDVNAFRAGFGSDTVTLADGTIQKITEGMRVSVADANRDLVRRIGEFQETVKGQIGAERFNAFSPQQQAAITSVAYNYGSLPDRILDAVRKGTNEEIATAIRSLQTDNNGVNATRRNKEAALFTTDANTEALAQKQQEDAKKLTDEAEKRKKEQEAFHTDQAASIAQTQFELGLEGQKLIAREQQKAIREAELAAQKAGTELTDQERKKILEVTAAKFAQKQVDEDAAAVKKEATDAETVVNNLLTQQKQLREQLALYIKGGDAGKTQETRDALKGVNEQLQTATEKAIAMWTAVGGPQADASIEKMKAAALAASNLGKEGQTSFLNWQRVGTLFASGVANAFDKFAKAVQEGKNVGEAAREAFLQFASDFLRQIAQMIIQQAVLNALKAAMPGFFGVGAAHTGGLVGGSRVGSGNATRRVDPSVFAGAVRMHTGGIAGIKPNEVPTILRKGEEVLTEDDPRHMLNGGLGGGAPAPSSGTPLRIINTFDTGEVVSHGLSGPVGEKAVLNLIKGNRTTIKGILGGVG